MVETRWSWHCRSQQWQPCCRCVSVLQADTSRTNCTGLSGLPKSGWQQATIHHVGDTSISDRNSVVRVLFWNSADGRRNSSFFHSVFPCEIFGVERNYILCFLNQEIIFVLGDSFLHASIGSSGFCMLVTEQLAWESPSVNRLLLKEKSYLILSRQDGNCLLELRYTCLP